MNNVLKAHNDLYEAELWAIEAESELNTLKGRNAEINRVLEERKADVQRLGREYGAQRTLCKELLAQFKRVQATMSTEEQNTIQEMLGTISTLDELNAEIEATNGRIELLHAGNPGLIEAYERRQQEIDRLEDTLKDFDARLASLNESVTELREKWEPGLDKLVSEISEAFSHNFAQIGCAGQVGIFKDDDDFSQWAIRIEVKFRYVKQSSLSSRIYLTLPTERTSSFHCWTPIASPAASAQCPPSSISWHSNHWHGRHSVSSMRSIRVWTRATNGWSTSAWWTLHAARTRASTSSSRRSCCRASSTMNVWWCILSTVEKLCRRTTVRWI